MREPYIPSARDAVVAYFGVTAAKVYRTRCVTCCDSRPLTEPSKVYGDGFVAEPAAIGSAEEERCDLCDASIAELGARCQREHEDQQARWAREARVDVLVEYGIPSAVRCRVY